MAIPLATVDDVRELFPASADPGMSDVQISRLILKASALLRQRARWVDERIERYEANPADDGGLDPMLVASVVATIVKRFLINPSGATNMSETIGPYSQSTGYALRGDKDVRGELMVIDSDLEKLRVPRTVTPFFGTMRISPGLRPSSQGSLGAVGSDSGIPGSGWVTPPGGGS